MHFSRRHLLLYFISLSIISTIPQNWAYGASSPLETCGNFLRQILKPTPSPTTAKQLAETHATPTQHLLADVIQPLSYMDEIPLSALSNHSGRDIAEALISWVRKHEIEITDHSEYAKVDLMAESQIVLFFNLRLLNLIWEKGFLNFFQTNSTAGGIRSAEEESRLLGLTLPLEADYLSLRPKSAFLNISADVELGPSNRQIRRIMEQYGNVGAVMSHAVKNRSLWTTQDAMGLGMNHNKFRNINELPIDRGTFSRGYFPNDPVDRRFYPDIMKHNAFTAEALIYGSLDFTDVDHFTIMNENIASHLKPLGKPIFLIDQQEANGRHKIVYKKLLFKGNSIPKSLPLNEFKKFYPVRHWISHLTK